jgi:hypothetical protein
LDAAGQEGVAGTPWTEDEVSAVVESYFRMLAWERAGTPYNKTENRRRLMTTVHRSEGSIERNLQNISAVLDVLGAQWINGYKPLAHYQDALVAAVERTPGQEPRFLEPGNVGAPTPVEEGAILVPPPPFADPDETLTPAVRRLVGKFDPAERDARNRDLGKAGERFVVEFERDRLRRAGRDDLADDVRWVSDVSPRLPRPLLAVDCCDLGPGLRRRRATRKAAAELDLVLVLLTQDARFSPVRCASESGARADINMPTLL